MIPKGNTLSYPKRLKAPLGKNHRPPKANNQALTAKIIQQIQ
jgi:hypothetical protein